MYGIWEGDICSCGCVEGCGRVVTARLTQTRLVIAENREMCIV